MSSLQPHNRIKFLTGLTLFMMGIFIVRLFYLQIIENSKYVNLAAQEQIKSLTLFAKRGEIYALDGTSPVKMVLNQTVYTAFVDPTEITNPNGVVDAIRSIAGGNMRNNIDALVRHKPQRYEVIADNLTHQQAALLQEKHLTGLGLQQTSRRVYPEGNLAAQVLGFVNSAGQGQYGVEGALNSHLAGKNGLIKSVTDISNVPLTIGRENTQIPAKNGENVVLTMDRNIQAYTEQALSKGLKQAGATKGSAIVVDPQTGRVLAMANLPSYNPENYSKVTNEAVFQNDIISSPYEPGSVMKTFTAAIGIDNGAILPTSTYDNVDTIRLQGAPAIGNATDGQTGNITFQHALNYSLNTGYVTVADRLGGVHNPPGVATVNDKARNIMYNYLYNRFKLGQISGIQLGGEAPGTIISPSDKSGQGNAFRYANMSFGQGMDLTMLQVATGFSAIVNGGIYHKPTIVDGSMSDDGTFTKVNLSAGKRILSEDTSRLTKKMIHDARASLYSADDTPGYDIGGKTGTSQTLINGSYDNNQTTASYLGYGGDSKPRYVIMVQVSSPGKTFEGNRDAMPIFTNISNWLINYMQLQPKG